MSGKFRASVKTRTGKSLPPTAKPDGAPGEKTDSAGAKSGNANIGKGKIFAVLVPATALAAGIYIAAVRLRFEPIFHIYWLVSTVLLCAALFLDKQKEYRYTKDRQDVGADEAARRYALRKKRVKFVLLALLPFLFTVLADAVYLLFLSDLHIFQAVSDLAA